MLRISAQRNKIPSRARVERRREGMMITFSPVVGSDSACASGPASAGHSDSGSASVAVAVDPVRAGPADVAGYASGPDYLVCYPSFELLHLLDAANEGIRQEK